MAIEPRSEEIQQFVDITGDTREIATKFLKEHPNIQTALGNYFEPPIEAPNSQWDNTFFGNTNDRSWEKDPFHSDKTTVYGPENQPQGNFKLIVDPPAAYTIHSQDTLNPTIFEGGITRPPSRVSDRPLANNGLGNTQPRSVLDQEEENIQKALAISMNQKMSGQEVGVTDPGSHFGPATEAYYDNAKWAMTSARSHAQEILQNPDPEHRKREPGVPAFMKPSLTGNYIPPLITILHAVPLAREALIGRGNLLKDYGHNDDWWDGQSIEIPKLVNVDQPTNEPEAEEVIYEFQRHMAFLDQTDRAYGNAEVLSNLDALRKCRTSDIENELLHNWSANVAKVYPDFGLGSVFQNSASIDHSVKTFYSLDLPLTGDMLDSGMNLYDALDDALWTGYRASDPQEIFLTKVADVLVINAYRQSGKGSGLGIKIPSVWYADRYLKESIAATREMRLSRDAVAGEVEKIENAQIKLTRFQDLRKSITTLDTKKLLEVAKSHFETSPESHVVKSSSKEEDLMSFDLQPSSTPYSQIAEELQAVADRVSQKLLALEHSKEQALEKLRELSKMYTKPSENANEPPNHKYTLRGVSTDPHITYVLANPNGADDLTDTDETEWQWWRLKFSSGEACPVQCAKVREIEVLKAAKDESTRVLLVYASENAVSCESEELPSQLLNFVRADNLAFEGEFNKTISPRQATPTKRKATGSFDEAPFNDSETNWGGWQDASPPQKQLPMGFQSPPTTNPRQFPMQPPPTYTRNKPLPQPPSSTSVRSPSSRESEEYDESVPLSLQVPSAAVDPRALAYTDVNHLGDLNEGQEMQERSGGMGVVPGGTGVGVGRYALGSYVPEIDMDDVEDFGKDGEGNSG